ncbi:hypothetical protein ACJZ2D_009730 [Fusarium nematophilum]
MANNSCNPIFDNGTSIAGDPLAGERGCNLGAYPPYVVNATEAGHVQAALKFINRLNLRVSIKNTGHSSKTVLYGSLSIWTHHMKHVEFHKDFQSTCGTSSSQNALTVGAGLQDEEIFHAAAKHGMAVVGGTNGDVGLVCWATGGGHGYLTSEFGMGADNITQAVVVTASGNILTANECENQDLLWAIRRGGGGTFGVITELTFKAHRMPLATTLLLNVEKTTNCTLCWWDLMAELHALLRYLKREVSRPTTPSEADVSNPTIAGSMSASSAAVDNSLNPAWRDTVVHLITKESWEDSAVHASQRSPGRHDECQGRGSTKPGPELRRIL